MTVVYPDNIIAALDYAINAREAEERQSQFFAPSAMLETWRSVRASLRRGELLIVDPAAGAQK